MKRIAIWGIKKTGKELAESIKKNGPYIVNCLIDNNIKEQADLNHRYVSYDDFLKQYGKITDAIIISSRNNDSIVEIINQIKTSWDGKVGVINHSFVDYKKIIDFSNSNTVTWITDNSEKCIWYLQAILTKKCNLSCKGCSHFANLFNTHNNDCEYDIKKFRDDLTIIAQNSNIGRFRLLGGEPFLLNNLIDYIKISRELLIKSDIRLVTNGLLIPGISDAILDNIKYANIGIEISPYKPTLSILSQIKKRLDEKKILYSYNGLDISNGLISCFAKNIDLSGNSNPRKAMKKCFARGCRTIFNGKLYKCPIDLFLPDFKDYFEINNGIKSSGIKINSVENWNEIIKKLNEEPVNNCKYCSTDIEKFEWSVTNKPELDDWIVDF